MNTGVEAANPKRGPALSRLSRIAADGNVISGRMLIANDECSINGTSGSDPQTFGARVDLQDLMCRPS